MRFQSIVALSGLVSLAAAVPLAKRDVVWIVETEVDIVTVPVTTTVWVDATNAPLLPRPTSRYEHQPAYTKPAAPSWPTESSSAEPSNSSPEVASVASSINSVYISTPAPTSIQVAPTTYITPTSPPPTYVAPTPSQTPVAAAASQAPAPSPAVPAPASYSSTSGWTCPSTFGLAAAVSGAAAPGSSFTGDLTWFQDGLGACGCTNAASDHIVAVSQALFDLYTPDGNPNKNSLCGKTVTIQGAGGTFTATIVDRCVGCKAGDLDLSEEFFNTVTQNGNGRVPGVSWRFD